MYWNERNDANIDQSTLRSWQGYAAQISAKAHCLLDDGYDGEDAGIVREQANELARLSASSNLSDIRTGYYALKKWVDVQKPKQAVQPAPKQAEVVVGGFGSLLSQAGRR